MPFATSTAYDLCIVGAGMYGSAAARHASANPAFRVCLVGPDEPTPEEKPKREIFSCHYDEGRISSVIDNPACLVLSRIAMSRYREIEKLSGIPFYHPVGFLIICQRGSAFLSEIEQHATAGNLPLVDLSHGDILKKRYPYISIREDECALLEDVGGGHISARNLVAAQQKIAADQGCTVVREVVERVEPLQDGVHQVTTESGTVIRAKRVLVCTGSFTNFKDLVPTEDGRKPDITVRQEMVAFLKLPPAEVERLSSMPTIINYRTRDEEQRVETYILPPIRYPDGNTYLKIGHFDNEGEKMETLKEIKDWYLSKGDARVIGKLSSHLTKMLNLKDVEVSSMTCATCRSPSDLPYIDRVSPTLTLAVVGNAKGAKFSEEVGRLAAELSLYGKWDSELDHEQFRIIWK